VVNSDLDKGGTWAGAVEQLDKLRFAPVFVRSTGEANRALDALLERGAHLWPTPSVPDNLLEQLSEAASRPATITVAAAAPTAGQNRSDASAESPADALFRTVKHVVLSLLEEPKSETEVADLLDVSRGQVREWLQRMVERGVVLRNTRPTRYSTVRQPDRAGTSA
jgi:DNA processing protein